MSHTKQYTIIVNPVFAEIAEKGSKFIAYIFPVQDGQEIKNQIQKIKILHPKARHWCYAWRLGQLSDSFKSSDDGEPSGTAGKPILNQIDSANLINTLIVVVRYFGGALLGTSGLIKAYKEAAKKSIETATLVAFEPTIKYLFQSNAAKIQTLLSILKEFEIPIHNYTIAEESSILFQLPLDKEEMYFRKIKSKLEKLNASQIENPMLFKDCTIKVIND